VPSAVVHRITELLGMSGLEHRFMNAPVENHSSILATVCLYTSEISKPMVTMSVDYEEFRTSLFEDPLGCILLYFSGYVCFHFLL
jgi:hypothetical protein